MQREVNRPGKRLADGDGFQDDSSTPVSKLHNKPVLQHCEINPVSSKKVFNIYPRK